MVDIYARFDVIVSNIFFLKLGMIQNVIEINVTVALGVFCIVSLLSLGESLLNWLA